MKQVAFMFPGQGSQDIGMGKEFYEAYPEIKEMYQETDRVLNLSLSDIMFNGPKETLTATQNAQPALLLSSIAVHTLLLKSEIQPVMAVGHSLGEYSALVAAGAISLEDAVQLVQTRGKLMEEAFPSGKGAMAAVLGLTVEKVKETLSALETDEIVDLANINCPGQIVISGSKEGIEQATPVLKENGAKRVLPLNVSGPFHSRLMKAANEKFAGKLGAVSITDATIPVYANVTASPVTKHEEIKDLLIQQLYSPVRFEESIRNMIDKGVDAFVEVGNGKVLSGLVKKIDRTIPTFAIQNPKSMEEFITWYREET
ncbi:[acyl-carrier-protein] S-malonyltransferase [Virgibacillus phasianinus]|uniref:Malonyl CoA-acyl carrier protein transacylase n=1 Tax=Virgibacillus phasianinus TaxID=2017483 RepID=A0A220U6B9_9BACI|nr:ACP S-malonyltransferase [Virgibacillus phasianinus]ASK63522.1 [acyl-carrier-protein] S-malonyltransferase [Virgibacillus phasianinus]